MTLFSILRSHKGPVSYGYLPSVLSVVMVTVLLSCLLGLVVYRKSITYLKNSADVASYQIVQAFQEKIQETSSIVTYIGKRIVKVGVDDIQKIAANVFVSPASNSREDLSYTWTFFDWIDADDRLRVSQVGIMPDSPSMKLREYTVTARQYPWTLQLCKPAVGIPSGLWIIPFGMGIRDDLGNHLGIVSGGLQVDQLISMFQRAIGKDKIDFLVLDEQLNVVLHTSQLTLNKPNEITYKNKAVRPSTFDLPAQQLKNPVCFDQIKYYNYKKVKGSPYVVLTGFNTETIWEEFINSFLPYFFEMIIITFICLIVLYKLWKKMADSVFCFSSIAQEISQGKLEIAIPPQKSFEMRHFANSLERVISYIKQCELKYREIEQDLNRIKTSNDAREDFLYQVNMDIQNSLLVTLAYANALLKNLKGELDIGLAEETQVHFLNNIASAVLDLQLSVSNILNPSSVDIKVAIEAALNVRLKDALLKKITLQYSIDSSIPLFYIDEVKFKQIVIGLVSRAILYTPMGGQIDVTARVTSLNSQMFLEVIIQDNGFGLGEEDLERLLNKFDVQKSWKKLAGIDLELSTIEKLAKLQKGFLFTENVWGKGSVVRTLIPYESRIECTPKRIGFSL